MAYKLATEKFGYKGLYCIMQDLEISIEQGRIESNILNI